MAMVEIEHIDTDKLLSKVKRRKDGRIQKSITVTENGVKTRKVFYGKTEQEILQKIFNYKEKRENEKLFSNVAEDWAERHFPTLAPRTLSCYQAPLKRAIEFFRGQYITDITCMSLYLFIEKIASQGFSRKTVTHHKIVLNLIFRHSAIMGYRNDNPMLFVSIPKNLPKHQREFPSETDLDKIKSSYGCTFSLFYQLILYTGLRRGEALALTYENIDFEKNLIHVRQSLYHENGKPVIKLPKTYAGIRCVPILKPLRDILQPVKSFGPVFSTANNEFLTLREFERRLRAFQKEADVKTMPHQLRHAFATILFESNVSDKDAQDLLGHAQISTTKDIYTHITKLHKEETAEKINNYLLNA